MCSNNEELQITIGHETHICSECVVEARRLHNTYVGCSGNAGCYPQFDTSAWLTLQSFVVRRQAQSLGPMFRPRPTLNLACKLLKIALGSFVSCKSHHEEPAQNHMQCAAEKGKLRSGLQMQGCDD